MTHHKIQTKEMRMINLTRNSPNVIKVVVTVAGAIAATMATTVTMVKKVEVMTMTRHRADREALVLVG